WRSDGTKAFAAALADQPEHVQAALEERLFSLIGDLNAHDVNADRFDRIQDFTRNFAIVPLSARTGEGIPDLLLLLIGLSQRFLSDRIREEEGRGEGTVLEVKEEHGLGTTIDVILYRGVLRRGDSIAIGGIERPIRTRIKAILKPRPLDEIRDPRDQFQQVDEVSAAAGVKILGPDLDEVVPGSPLIVVKGDEEPDIACSGNFEQGTEGVTIKADTLGSLEALQFECREAEIPIRRTGIGPVSRSDVMEVSALTDPRQRIILAFNVKVTPDA
ncbi:MAG TPA: translation initiation factor IF-2, partial [Thermoplasmata archaeon]|nr:translation initiation factor IF-2 [Thermoplasmata archaeon]